MSEETLANRLFGEEPDPVDNGEHEKKEEFKDTIKGATTRIEPGVEEVIYGGNVLDSYEPIIAPVFEQEAFKARFEGNHEEALTIDKAAQELGTVFKEYEVTDLLAKEIMLEAGDYLRAQRSETAIMNEEESTFKALSEKYGDDLNKNLAGARRVAHEIGKRIPNFINTLERTGLGNNLKVGEALIQLASKKGYIR